MVKSYFLMYGAQNIEVDELGKRIGSLLNMQIMLRSSLYVGDYVNCIGPQADRLTIEPHLEGDGETVKHEEFSQYSTFVEVSNIKGKNMDKEGRNSKMKEFFATIPELVLLKETVLETEN